MKKGVFKKGQVKKTFNQAKKHKSQLNKKEINYLLKHLWTVKRFTFSNHLKAKMAKGEVTPQIAIMKKTLVDAKECIIEYNQKLDLNGEVISRRVLLRSKQMELVNIKGEGQVLCNLCFVVDVDTGVIITAYFNSVKDAHETLDKKRYDANLSIAGW